MRKKNILLICILMLGFFIVDAQNLTDEVISLPEMECYGNHGKCRIVTITPDGNRTFTYSKGNLIFR